MDFAPNAFERYAPRETRGRLLKSIFSSEAEAIELAWRVIPRLAELLTWGLIALAHLTLAWIALFALWALQVSPTDIQTGFQAMAYSKPVLIYGGLGGSILGVAALYWKLIRWAHKATYSGWLYRFLMRGA